MEFYLTKNIQSCAAKAFFDDNVKRQLTQDNDKVLCDVLISIIVFYVVVTVIFIFPCTIQGKILMYGYILLLNS